LRYYETSPDKSRDERVKETLETMGTSILLGGTTTFLGVVPLFFSVTKIFMIVCLSFFAMVLLGLAHGLILFPVILSLVGPKDGLLSAKRGIAIEVPKDAGNVQKLDVEEERNA
jgi:predicted RND superfamily exporter protein